MLSNMKSGDRTSRSVLYMVSSMSCAGTEKRIAFQVTWKYPPDRPVVFVSMRCTVFESSSFHNDRISFSKCSFAFSFTFWHVVYVSMQLSDFESSSSRIVRASFVIAGVPRPKRKWSKLLYTE